MVSSLALVLSLATMSQESGLRKMVWASHMVGPFREGDELVQYWEVEKAMANGKPDPAAPGNSWHEARTSFTKIADSRGVPCDSNGARWIYIPRFAMRDEREYHETAPASAGLQGLFRVVAPGGETSSSMTSDGHVQKVSAGYRCLAFRGLTVTSTHEVRTLGKERVHRWTVERTLSSTVVVMGKDQSYDPFTDLVKSDPEIKA